MQFINLNKDFKAGLNVALLAIPQGMAYALIAGLPLYYGLLASGTAALVGGLIGGGKFITLGPTNATAVLLFGVFLQLKMVSTEGQLLENAFHILPSILLFTGIWLLIAGLFRISFLIKFISRTVITGYITAAAFLIIINQLDSVLGLQNNLPLGTNFFQTIYYIADNFSSFSIASVYLSGITAISYYFLQGKFKVLPNVAISLLLGTLAGKFLISHDYVVTCLKAFEPNLMPQSIPSFELFLEYWEVILQSSFAIALLCLIEGLSIGKSLASKNGKRISSDRESVSFGMANLSCAFLSGMPASGSLTRSTLNVNSGAKSKISNVFAGIFIFLGYLYLGEIVSWIPISVLSTLVVIIGISLIKKNQIITAIKSSRSDGLTFAVTFFVGLIFSLQFAIFVGVLTSLFLFLKKVAEPEMTEHGYNDKGELTYVPKKSKSSQPEVSIVHVEGELFFAAADLFYEQIRRVGENRNIKVLVLKLLNAHHLDATSVLALEELLEYYNEKKCHVLLCEVRKDALRILKNSGLLGRINRKNIFPHVRSNPTLSTAKAIRRSKFLLSHNEANVTIYSQERKGL